jgi:hypothetical protein
VLAAHLAHLQPPTPAVATVPVTTLVHLVPDRQPRARAARFLFLATADPASCALYSELTREHFLALQSMSATSEQPGGTLTMFYGVLVPCVLSIFSVILFLRMG